jgi:hypothetical protein
VKAPRRARRWYSPRMPTRRHRPRARHQPPGGSSTGSRRRCRHSPSAWRSSSKRCPAARTVGILLDAGDTPEDLDIPDRAFRGPTAHLPQAFPQISGSARSDIAACERASRRVVHPLQRHRVFPRRRRAGRAQPEAKVPRSSRRVEVRRWGGLLAYQPHGPRIPARTASASRGREASCREGPPGESLVVEASAAYELGRGTSTPRARSA